MQDYPAFLSGHRIIQVVGDYGFEDSKGLKNIYLTKKIHVPWQYTLDVSFLWDQNQFHITYIETSTMDIEYQSVSYTGKGSRIY